MESFRTIENRELSLSIIEHHGSDCPSLHSVELEEEKEKELESHSLQVGSIDSCDMNDDATVNLTP